MWVPYRISCYVARSSVDPGTEVVADILSASPIAQVSDVLSLLQDSGVSSSSNQTSDLVALATTNYDMPPPSALDNTQNLVESINNQLAALGDTSQDGGLLERGGARGEAFGISDIVTNFGQKTALILARNRIMNVLVRAESVNQQ
jgi:hypothetical protein